nr:glycosyltransferase family 4 protein [Oryzicola mucosus]
MTVDVSAATAFLSQERLRRRREVREALGVAEDAPVFLYVGRLEPVKGPDLLLAAFNREEVSKSARLIVVGDGTMRGKIEAAARADPRIVSRGRLEGPALWAQFASADVLVVPSRSESWGLVVNEALVAGLTVIVADCAGCIGDLIQDEVNGLIFPTHSVEALGSALARLSHGPALRTFLKGNAAATIADWTTEAWAGNILAAWRDSLSDRQPGLQDAT